MITKKRALEIAKDLYGNRKGMEYIVSEARDESFMVYGITDRDNLWYVNVADKQGIPMFSDSTIVLIRKDTGEVVFHGKASD